VNIDKIGMYKTDEILEFMTEGEGRGFLGRSMFDAMYFEIERLNNIINELEKWLDKKEKLTFNSWNKGIHEVQKKLQELKGADK
jgi:hypothetical protein